MEADLHAKWLADPENAERFERARAEEPTKSRRLRNPELEQRILECTDRKIKAQVVVRAKHDALIEVYGQLQNATDADAVAEKLQRAREERESATRAVDREISALADLLKQQADWVRKEMRAERIGE